MVNDSQSAAAAVISWDAALPATPAADSLPGRDHRLLVSRVLRRDDRNSAALSKLTDRLSLLSDPTATREFRRFRDHP
jgi:hypothetical protein